MNRRQRYGKQNRGRRVFHFSQARRRSRGVSSWLAAEAEPARAAPPEAAEAERLVGLFDSERARESYRWMESASEKIGKYSDTSTKPTKTAMTIMIIGSMRLSIAVTRVETSSS